MENDLEKRKDFSMVIPMQMETARVIPKGSVMVKQRGYVKGTLMMKEKVRDCFLHM